MIISENIKVKKKAIYSSVNLVMHCLLQSILTRQRRSNMMMMRSDENERNENLYSTIRYNLTWLKEKLLTLLLSKTKNETSLDASIETMSHHQRSMTHRQLKMTQDWVYHIIMLSYEAVLAFASMFNENSTHVSHCCTQTMNAATASDHLIIIIYHALALIKTRKDKYVYQKS